MFTNITEPHGFLNYLFVELPDPRVKQWPLMRNPIWTIGILLFYLYFVKSLGPSLMKSRKPIKLKNTLILYNFSQVLVSIYLFCESLDAAWLRDYSLICQPVDYSPCPNSLRVARVCYLYFVCKLVELLDTVFFVLRKKNNQITFLHIYHHTTMPIITWVITRYIPGGQESFMVPVNSFVHIIMYTYYMLSAMGPQLQKYLWWKKYLTTIQLTQFCIGFVHSGMVFVVDCGYPKYPIFVSLPYVTVLYILFANFYNKAYQNKDEIKVQTYEKSKLV